MGSAYIEIRNMTKQFSGQVILNDVSASFDKGKIHGLIGRNGSGKTVLLKCLCGFTSYESGDIEVEGQRIGGSLEMPRSFAAIIETPGFLPRYSAYTNLKFLADLVPGLDKNRVKLALGKVGLEHTGRKKVGKFSLGMRQRLAIAQVIMDDPDLLILDEPLSGLDTAGVEDIRRLLIECKEEGKTIVFASHNKEDIETLCDTVHEVEDASLKRLV